MWFPTDGGGSWPIPNGSHQNSSNVFGSSSSTVNGTVFGSPGTSNSVFGTVNGGSSGGISGGVFGTPPNTSNAWANFSGANPFSGKAEMLFIRYGGKRESHMNQLYIFLRAWEAHFSNGHAKISNVDSSHYFISISLCFLIQYTHFWYDLIATYFLSSKFLAVTVSLQLQLKCFQLSAVFHVNIYSFRRLDIHK